MSAPRSCPDETLMLVTGLRRSGLSYRKICAILNGRGIPTPLGGPTWYESYVWRLLRTAEGRRLMSEDF